MKFNVLTLFPELFEQYLSQTILKRASDKDIINFNIVNIRDYARNKHNQMDDIPFGGGAGMVLKPEAYWNFFYENYDFYGLAVFLVEIKKLRKAFLKTANP